MKKFLTTKNFFLFVIFCPPLYLVKLSLFGLPTNLFEILMILAILLWLKDIKKIYTYARFPKVIILSLSLIFFGLILSSVFGSNYLSELGIIKSWFTIPFAFSFATYTIFNSNKEIESILKTIFLSCLTVSVIAIFYKIFGVVTYDNRLEAVFTSPNYLAMSLAPGIIIGFILLLNKKKDYIIILSLTIITLAFYFTFSYSGWFAVFTSIVIFIWLKSNKKQKVYLSAIVFSLFSLFAINQFHTAKFNSLIHNDPRSSLSSRIMIWRSSLLMIKQHPIAGIGPGNFQTAYLSLQPYFPPYLEWAVPHPHNIILAFWLQTSIFGLIGFLIMLSYLIYILAKLVHKKTDVKASVLFVYFLYFIFQGLFDTPFWKNDLAFIFWIFFFRSLSIYQSNFKKSTTC